MAAQGEEPAAPTRRDEAATGGNGIGQLNENSLHAAVKAWCAQPGDRLEAPVDGYFIDILRDDLLIEVQTRNFAALKAKLAALLAAHAVRLVYPLVAEKWIAHVDVDDPGHVIRRRKSPRRGHVADLFAELVYIPELINHPRFTLHVLWVQVEEVRCADGRGSWRRGGASIVDQRLLAVTEARAFTSRDDLAGLLPDDLAQPFTNQDLAAAMGIAPRRAQRVSYALRRMGAIAQEGKAGRRQLFRRCAPAGVNEIWAEDGIDAG